MECILQEMATDAIITYVDGRDPLWQQDYALTIGSQKPLTKRFRDWGTLPYLLRSIRKYMPFVDNVYLVVARESQIPAWVNEEKLKIVLHEDIMPRECLPSFSAAAIELFLHRIPGLKEQYIYFNDDFFVVQPLCEEDFFKDGKCFVGFSNCLFAYNMFKKQVRCADRVAREAAGVAQGLFFKRPQHACAAMFKSCCEELFDKCGKDIFIPNAKPLRGEESLCQYVYTDYALFTGRAINRRISKKHISLATATEKQISSFFDNPDKKTICINDVEMSDARFLSLSEAISKSLEKKFPEKTEFEK